MSFRVVIIEDDKVTLKLIEGTLAKVGYEIFTADDGAKGLELINKERPDLVISDMLIPGIHGLELVQKIRQDPELKDIPVILMSAVYKSLKFKKDIDESGADYFVQKPLDMPHLFDLIKEILSPKEE